MNEAASAAVAAEPAASVVAPSLPPSPSMGKRLREWIEALHRNPSLEEQAARERRERLLDELNHAVADAPDDLPLREVIYRINHRDQD